jgi:hypothetical protein
MGTVGANDFWFVGGGATASNAGFMEISTGDDGQTAGSSEPIYVRQYGPGNPLTGTLVRTATLLDASGNTSFPGTVTAPTFSGALSGTASGNVVSRGQSNWNDSTVIGNVVGMLSWKNYGNGHVIFDASQGTSPSGGGVSQTNATNAWTATYPTLMGWNGSQTYGVRVDTARYADSAGSAGSVSNGVYTNATTNSLSGILNFGAMNGTPYANPTGTSNGISFGGYETTLRMYGIFTELENVGGNYSKLTLNYHTGIRLGASTSYGGTRFYSDSVGSGTMIFSVGNGDSNVRVVNSLFIGGNTAWHAGNAPRASNSNLMYYQGFTLDANTMETNSTGFTYSNNAPFTGPIARFSTGGAYDLWLNATYGGGGAQIAFRTRNGDAGTFNSWHSFVTSASSGSVGGELTVNGNITMGSGGASSIYMRDSDEGTRELHCNSNRIGFLTQAGSWGSWCDDSGNWITGAGMYAGAFYDQNNTAYYLDPDSESNLYRFTSATMTRNAINYLSINSPFVTRSSQPRNYQTGSMGWGQVDFNVVFSNWGSGFYDTWSTPGNAPGGSSHYIGLQSLHYAFENNTNAYGFQMACAGEAVNRYFWRNGWPAINGWVEMVHTGNIAAQVAANTAGNTNSISSATGGAYTWTAANYFQSNLGGYSGGLNTPPLQVYATGGNSAFMSFHRAGNYAVNFGLDADNVLRMGGWSAAGDRWQLDMSGNQTVAGRVTANADVYSLGGWFYSNNNAGWYNNTYGQGLRTAKGNVTYGSIINIGENFNGYGGYAITNNFNTIFMQNSSGDHGFFRDGGGGGWSFFYHQNFNCAGIGTDATDPSYSLHIIKYGGSNTGWIIWSDRRIKENIKTIDNALDKVLSLRGVYYNKIDDPNKERCVGYIAQEVMEVVPELVVYSEELDMYNMNYGPMVSMLTEAVKEHHAKTVAQQAEIDTLKEQVQALLNHINNGI